MVFAEEQLLVPAIAPVDFPSSFFSRPFRKSFSLNQRGIAMRNDLNPRGANVRYVSTSRSNFRNGLS